MAHIFISYSRVDAAAARSLRDKLRARSFQVWFDEDALLPGQKWESEIDGALRTASAVVVLLSANSVGRTGYAQKEIRVALDAMDRMPDDRPFLVPVRVDACAIPRSLEHLHCGELRSNEDFERLTKALRHLTPPTSSARPGVPAIYQRLMGSFESGDEIILPGFGASGVSIGQSPQQVTSLLGEPNKRSDYDDFFFLMYYSRGIDVRVDNGAVTAIFLFAAGKDGHSAYLGSTPEKISTTSTRREIENTYGRPSYVGGEGVIDYWESYKDIGLSITYDTTDTSDLDAKVRNLVVRQAGE